MFLLIANRSFLVFLFFFLSCMYHVSEVLLTALAEGLSLVCVCVCVTFHVVPCVVGLHHSHEGSMNTVAAFHTISDPG